ncbi:MAG TPA: class F sortase [Blastococcus sp.]|nr:class F sortase [Blastococcus sp.]
MVTTAVCGLVGGVGVAEAAAQAPGLLRVADLSPDTPALDLAVAPVVSGVPLTAPGSLIGSGLHYGSVGAYRSLAPGNYAVSVRAAGAGPATPPVLSTRVTVPAGGARTVTVTGPFAALALRVLPDDLSAPSPGSARVGVLSGASPPLAVALSGAADRPVAVPTGDAASVVVPAGAATVRLRAGSGAVADLPVVLRSGSVVSLIVLDRPGGGLILSVVVDAAGPSVIPRGPVDAGAGGTAGLPVAPLVAGVAVSLMAAAAGVRGRRRVVLGAAAALVLATVAPATAAEPSNPAGPGPRPALVASVVPQAAPGAAPLRVRVPAAGVDAAVSPVGVDRSGALLPPPDTARVGWFRGSSAPGVAGPAVLAGHVDSVSGPGAFFRLGRLAAGEAVLVTRADGTTVRFRVTRVARYPKTAFPTATVYGPTPGAELRLITCGGRFDRAHRSYVDDVVVFARLDD